jgi:hypothetical protein
VDKPENIEKIGSGLVFYFKNKDHGLDLQWGLPKQDVWSVFVDWFNHLPEKDRKDILKELEV